MLVPTDGKVLSAFTRNTHVIYQTLAFTVQKLFAMLKFRTEFRLTNRTKTICFESSILGHRDKEMDGQMNRIHLIYEGKRRERERERERERNRQSIHR